MAREVYVAPLRHRPETPEYDAGFVAMYGHRCRECKRPMKGEPVTAIWCKRCKAKDERRP